MPRTSWAILSVFVFVGTGLSGRRWAQEAGQETSPEALRSDDCGRPPRRSQIPF